jgi:quinol monooxygenase YgiN
MGPRNPMSTVLTPVEEAIIVEFARRTLLPLDDVLGCLMTAFRSLRDPVFTDAWSGIVVRVAGSVRWPSKQQKIMTKFALYVPLEAKPGKEKDVADFLRSAVPLVNAEAGTVSWYAIQEGPSSFAIFDTFDDEAGRDAHLNGKVAAALMEKVKAGDMFAKTPEIHKLGIIADKLAK